MAAPVWPALTSWEVNSRAGRSGKNRKKILPPFSEMAIISPMKRTMPKLVVASRLLLPMITLAALAWLGGCGGNDKATPYSLKMEREKSRLFAYQPLPELMNMAQPPTGTAAGDAWDLFTKAYEEVKGNKEAEAKKSLKSILSQTNLETRFHLWAWTALRALGEQPEAALASKVQGVVVESPAGPSVDTYAVYADNTVRTITGDNLTVFEKLGPASKDLVKKMLGSGQAQLSSAVLVTNHPPLFKQESRLTILTYGGVYSMSDTGAKSKWKMPDDVTQNISQLTVTIMEEAAKAARRGTP
jgi:hypothetical protein